MVNKPKAKGTAAETRVVNFLLAAGFDARRVVMKGSHDQGDIHIEGTADQYGICLEVKGGKQTSKIGRKQREDWLAETRAEGNHSGMDTYLVIAKHGASPYNYEVWSDDGHMFWYLDEFINVHAVARLRKVMLP